MRVRAYILLPRYRLRVGVGVANHEIDILFRKVYHVATALGASA